MPVKHILRFVTLLAVLLIVAACGNGSASQSIATQGPEETSESPTEAIAEPTMPAIPTPNPTAEAELQEQQNAEDEGEEGEAGDSAETEPATTASGLKGPIVVGSRDFTEQFVLAYITMRLLEENGFEVVNNTGLGGTNTAHYALVDDEIDISWEYTGTALSEFHNIPTSGLPSDLGIAWDMASSLDKVHHNLVWLKPGKFNDTYTLMIREGTISAELNSIEDLASFMNENSAPLTLCVENDFYSRGDGLFPLQTYYDFQFREENINLVGYDQLYEGLRDGTCDVAEGFSTDGRIAAWGFKNLEDSKAFFPAYNAAPIIRQEILDQYPEIEEILAQVADLLDNETITQLNAQVDLGADGVRSSGDELSLEELAGEFLNKNALIGDRPELTLATFGSLGPELAIMRAVGAQILLDAGFQVTEVQFETPQEARAALEANEVQIAWDLTARTLVTVHAMPAQAIPKSSEEIHTLIASLDTEHANLAWQAPALFESKLAILYQPGSAVGELSTASDLAGFLQTSATPPTLCVENGMNERFLPQLDAVHGITFAEDAKTVSDMDTALRNLRNGICDMAIARITDGRVAAWGLQALPDPDAIFPVTSIAPIVRQETLDAYPELSDLLTRAHPLIDTAQISLLSAQVGLGADGLFDTGDEIPLRELAQSFLDESGLLADKPQIAVGSRDFTEQFVLAYLSILLLEENGFNVVDRTGLGGTNTGYSTLNSGGVDVLWEYTGTALSNFHDTGLLPSDPLLAWEMVRELDEPNQLNWLTPGEFNDTYTLMINPQLLEVSDQLQSIDDLSTYMNENESPLTVCVENDFYSRDDGLYPLMEYYGFSFAEENILLVAYDQLYDSLRTGECDVAEGFSTDGRIAAWGFQNLEDSGLYFPAYNAAPIVRQDAIDANPQVVDILNQLGPLLTNDAITELNAQVDVGEDGERNSGDERSAKSVSRLFLCEQGLLSDCPNSVQVVAAPEDDAATADDGNGGEDDGGEAVAVSAESPRCEDILVNGTFELLDAWRLPITSSTADYSATQVHGGDWAMQLGAAGRGGVGSYSAVTQKLYVPETADSAEISFWYYPVSLDLVGGDENGLYIYDSTLTILQEQFLWEVSNQQAWVQGSYDLSNYVGKEIALHFVVINDGDGVPTSLFVDDVAVQVCFE